MRTVWKMLIIVLILGTTIHCHPSEAADRKKIGICFTAVGPGDLSFNNMLYKGSIELQAKYDIEFVYQTVTADTDKEFERALRELAEQADMVMTLGFQARGGLNAAAKAFPDTQFVLFDVVAEPAPNVSSVVYAQHEGGFIGGALAALVTQTKTVGFVAGVDIDILKAYISGFQQGVAYVDPSVKVLVEYCTLFPNFSGFSSPDKGYAIASKMIDAGADIVFNGAGGSGPGIIQAAVEHQKYAIGTDANQDYLAPGFVLTSVMKRLDTSMLDIGGKFMRGELTGNTVYEYAYRNGGISLTPMEFTKDKIPADVLEKVAAIEQKIISGDIVVTNLLTPPK
ncbi:nucleoside-binding protein [Candidatus Moduliflexus flocculans]|uniref:Nucleoside-binding protein n=1 Tax=Candidatus Moduliflexus flocculans TaxID=1499966 RepID=A0A0S6VV73_9BACT|nr:nucleoside-binding protein [Candidatus Moduliflexus flocculans]